MSIHVNGVEITSEAINIESAYHKESGVDPRYAHRRAAVALTVRELLRQRAIELGLAAPDDDDEESLDAAIDSLISQEVDIPSADEETCRHWYDKNPEKFQTKPLVEVRHILIAGHPEDLEERERARTTAEELIQQLKDDPDAFPRLAAEHSRCPSAKEGGHLGQVSNGETVEEFEAAALRLPVGLAEQPIKTRYGFHVIEVLQRVEGEQLPFAAVHDKIREYLEAGSHQRAINQYIKILSGAADIRGIDLEQSEAALIQ